MTPHYWRDAQTHLSNADPVMARLIEAYGGEMLRGRGEAFYTLARSIVGQQISVKAADAVWGKLESRVQNSEFSTSSCGGKANASLSLGERVRVRGVTPEIILTLSDDELRACGLSRQKILYLREIAAYFDRHKIGKGYFDDHSDEEVIKALISIKGIGVWTAEMFLMFHLLRPDVLPLLDIGLQKGMLTHYEDFQKSLTPMQNFIVETTVTPRARRGVSQDSAASAECEQTKDSRRNLPRVTPRGGNDIPQKIPKKHLYAAMTEHAKMWQPYRSVATWYLWRSLDPVPVEY